MQNIVLNSTKQVFENSAHVKINTEKLNEVSASLQINEVEHWVKFSPFDIYKLDLEQAVNFLLIMHSIGFCYWGMPKWTVEYKNQEFDGAYGMIAALGKAIENDYPVLDFSYLSKISKSDFANVLRGNVKIPLFSERLNIVREIGKAAANKFNVSFLSAVKEANTDLELMKIITDNFPSFSDKSSYKENEVYFYKKAQLLVSDLFQIVPKGMLKIKDTSNLTTCADYKIPQVLRSLGILEYSNDLAEKVDAKIEIPRDSEFEVEIRANTIWAIEKIKQNVKSRYESIESIFINDQLWLASQSNKDGRKPYHLTRTTAY